MRPQPPPMSYDNQTTISPSQSSITCIYCTSSNECFSYKQTN